MPFVQNSAGLQQHLVNCSLDRPIFAQYTFLNIAGEEKTLYLAFITPVGEMHTQSGSIVATEALIGFVTSPLSVQDDVTFTYRGILFNETSFYPEMFVSLELIDRSQVPVGLFWAEKI